MKQDQRSTGATQYQLVSFSQLVSASKFQLVRIRFSVLFISVWDSEIRCVNVIQSVRFCLSVSESLLTIWESFGTIFLKFQTILESFWMIKELFRTILELFASIFKSYGTIRGSMGNICKSF